MTCKEAVTQMTVGELKELVQNLPDEREVRVLVNGETYKIFDLGYDGNLDVEVVMAEER